MSIETYHVSVRFLPSGATITAVSRKKVGHRKSRKAYGCESECAHLAHAMDARAGKCVFAGAIVGIPSNCDFVTLDIHD